VTCYLACEADDVDAIRLRLPNYLQPARSSAHFVRRLSGIGRHAKAHILSCAFAAIRRRIASSRLAMASNGDDLLRAALPSWRPVAQ